MTGPLLERAPLPCAALFGATGVIAGAFGAHALQAVLEPSALSAWHTAVDYQLVHAVALLALAALGRGDSGRAFRVAAGAFVLGVLLFCGSLYLLAFGAPRWLGPVTPVGGVALVAGWLALFVHALGRSR